MRTWVYVLGLTCLMACSEDGGSVEADGGSDRADTGGSQPGEPDGGEPDAGEPDEPDGGEPDASEPDEPDGGEPDGGEPDGGEQQDAATQGDEPCTSCGACVESRPITSVEHVAGGIDYSDVPPFGGAHDACWTRFGVHTEEVPDEHWVHNLEHGAVVFLYHCPDGCEDELATLEFLAAPRPFAIVMPYAELPTRFGVVAWGHRLLTECFDEGALEEFYELYSDQGPESSTAPGGC